MPYRRGVARSGASQPCEREAPLKEPRAGLAPVAREPALPNLKHHLPPGQQPQSSPRQRMARLHGPVARPPLAMAQPRRPVQPKVPVRQWAAVLPQRERPQMAPHEPPESLPARYVPRAGKACGLRVRLGALPRPAAAQQPQPDAWERLPRLGPWQRRDQRADAKQWPVGPEVRQWLELNAAGERSSAVQGGQAEARFPATRQRPLEPRALRDEPVRARQPSGEPGSALRPALLSACWPEWPSSRLPVWRHGRDQSWV